MEEKQKIEISSYDFLAKCSKLNIPKSALPDEQYLKKIFRSYNSSLLQNFYERVNTKNEIERIRNVILIQKLKNIQQHGGNSSNLNTLPEELKTYLKYQEARQRVKVCEEENRKLRNKEQELLERIKKNDVQKRVNTKLLDDQKSKVNILQAFSIKLDEEIKNEKEIAQNIQKNNETLKGQNIQEEAINRIQKTMEILKEFSIRGIDTETAKEKCIKDVEIQLYNVPSLMTYEILIKKLQEIAEDSIFNTTDNSKASLAEELLEKLREIKINLGFELTTSKIQLLKAKQLCAEKIEKAGTEMDQTVMNSMYYDAEDDGYDSIVSLIPRLVLEGKLKLLRERIEGMRAANDCEGSQELIFNIEETNQLIGDKIENIHLDFIKIHQINEKYKSENTKVMRAANNLKVMKHKQMNRAILNQTLNQTGCLNESIVTPEIGLYQEELELFHKTPMKVNFNFELESMLIHSPITQQFSQNLSLFIKGIENLHSLVNEAYESNSELYPSTSLAENDEFVKEVINKHAENRKEILEIFDNITVKFVSVKSLLSNANQIYKFALNNPLKKFIDPLQKYENKSYIEYENEFMLYYKMIK